jgi:hypothetical protein
VKDARFGADEFRHATPWQNEPVSASQSVMARVNLTLDAESSMRLARYAKRLGRPQAAVAGELVREGLTRRDAEERRRKLARDYAADRPDAQTRLKALEVGQLEMMGDEEDP